MVADELEHDAHMTDAEAVRRAFDAQNAVSTAVGAAIFTLSDLLLFAWAATSHEAPPFAWLFALVMAAVSAPTAWIAYRITTASSKRGRQRFTGMAEVVMRSARDWVVGYLLAQFTVLCYAGTARSPVIWGTVFPWMLLAFRFTFVRRLLVYIALFAIAAIHLYARKLAGTPQVGASLAANYVITLLIGTLTSRRVRRRTLDEWSERRESALERLRMRDELRYARELQLSMLPETPPKLDWADVAATSIPATEVGGDYFDYIDVDGSLAVICGDVAGHGLSSGITLAALRGAIILLRKSLIRPAEVLERLHDVVAESSRRRTLVTLTAALFDPKRMRATIASAGHPPVLVHRRAGVEAIELFGPPLGARRMEPIPQREVVFDRGDVFLLHSDGIYETTNDSGAQYGLDRLMKLLASTDGSAAEVRDRILRSVETFRGIAPQEDDLTLVVVRMI